MTSDPAPCYSPIRTNVLYTRGSMDGTQLQDQVLTPREQGLRRLLADIDLFSRHAVGMPLRPYQLEPARAILDSVFHRRGRTFTVMMSRQAGKNELSAQLEA